MLGVIGLSIVVVFAAVAPAAGAVDTQHIFRINASGCSRPPEVRTQTGFRVKGVQGIVTALHGIVGCERIGAISDVAAMPDLKIASVDIDRDVAVITGPMVEGNGGLETASQQVSAGMVRVYGYPQGIGLTDIPLVVLSKATRPLGEMVPPRLWQALQRRRSPRLSINVISLNGDLQPGHSGAPVFNTADEVLGIGSGGLGDGTVGIGWAIPWADVTWSSVSTSITSSRLAELGASDPRAAFCYSVQQETCSQPWQWHLRIAVFGSIDKRSTTSLFGSNQAFGAFAALSVTFGTDLDLSIEGSSTLKNALDSVQGSSLIERHYLRDSFVSVTLGRIVRIGRRAQFIPLAGGGFAMLQTDRFRYTVERGAVHSVQQDFAQVLPSLAAGADVRFAVSPWLWIMANHRFHVLAGSADTGTARERMQQRSSVGIQVNP